MPDTHDVFTHVLLFNPLNALGNRHSTEAKIHTHHHTVEDWRGSGNIPSNTPPKATPNLQVPLSLTVPAREKQCVIGHTARSIVEIKSNQNSSNYKLKWRSMKFCFKVFLRKIKSIF